MKIVKLPKSALILTLLAGACAEQQPSQTQSLVGASDLRFLTLADRDTLPLAATVGSLSEVELSEEAPEFSEIYALCTGVQISPRHVLTAAHCQTPMGFVFDRHNIVEEADKDKLKYKTFGRLVRLMFTGDLIPESRDALHYKPSKEAVYTSASMDFAVWTFADLPARTFLDLRAYSRDVSDLALYGFPNGAPLTYADDCSGRPHASLSDRVLHDCDSLNGSSGGLLMDKKSGLPVGIHVKGSGNNDGDLYKQNGHFESVAELEKICASEECAGAEGMNQALAIEAITQDIITHSPELASELHLTETPCASY